MLGTVEQVLKGGSTIVQLRDYSSSDSKLLELARALREVTWKYSALFIVNNRPDIALLSEADGVHVGQEDLSVSQVRNILGPGKLVGVSTHALEQARKAIGDGADYLGVGPVYATPTKAGREPVTLDYVKEVSGLKSSVPFFAIGGIDGSNLEPVLEAGARRVAVVRALAEAQEPQKAAQAMIQILEKYPLS
jgi:thiamine-phosphate pyrophosphorylase